VRKGTIVESEAEDFESVLAQLANFRYLLRKFMSFSESAARVAGITPQQHQLMLGVAGFAENGKATISELAEFLQERHHSVVGLIDRAVLSGLVRREADVADRRVVLVSLTPRGRAILKRLSVQHSDEVNRLRDALLRFARQSASKTPHGLGPAHGTKPEAPSRGTHS
jgi:DNA-binding MarR family transcriptional regulator